MAASAATVGKLERERLLLVGQLQPLLKRQEELQTRLVDSTDNLDVILDALGVVKAKRSAIEKQVAALEAQKAEAAAVAGATLPHERIEWLVSDDSPEAIAERGRLNLHLKQLFKHIRIDWRDRVLWFRPRDSTGFRPDFYLPF
ncbi:hypothetical protein D3C78_1513440 [compost metagenome]